MSYLLHFQLVSDSCVSTKWLNQHIKILNKLFLILKTKVAFMEETFMAEANPGFNPSISQMQLLVRIINDAQSLNIMTQS